MAWLTLDIGSTHWKAGVYTHNGGETLVRRMPIPLHPDAAGHRVVHPDAMRQSLCHLIKDVPATLRQEVEGIGITGMAEGGLLLNRKSLKPKSALLPWFDSRAEKVFSRLEYDSRISGRYAMTGLPRAQKYSIFKILALLEETGLSADKVLWLGAVEYAAFLLTGARATDPTLAARTYAYNILDNRWDNAFLNSLGLDNGLFPPVLKSGSPAGFLTDAVAEESGLPRGLPVSVCGHDHLCAAYGARAFEENSLYCSAGTAQVLTARKPSQLLNEKDLQTGLSFGREPNGDLCVLGAIQSSGGSVNFMNTLLYGGEDFSEYLKEAGQSSLAHGELLYFPYLAGSGPPHMNSAARGAFIGFTDTTTRGDLLQSVYCGLAFETRMIIDAAGIRTGEMTISGGLTKHPQYMKALADTLNLNVKVASCQEGTLYGAARLIACRARQDFLPLAQGVSYEPDPETTERCQLAYEKQYLPMQKALGVFYLGQGGVERTDES